MTKIQTTPSSLPGAVLTTAQLEQLNGLATSVSQEQAIWLSGYFAGLGQIASTAVTPGAAPDAQAVANGAASNGTAARVITVLFASETGNSRELANSLSEAARDRGLEARVSDVSDYKVRSLKDEKDLLVIAATHGEGDPPQTALDFFEFLEGRKAPKLPDLRFSVLALGDSTYEHYCSAGRRVDERLAELGAERLTDRVECDVDYEDDAEAWIESVLERLAAEAESAAPAADAPSFGVVPANGATEVAAPAYNKKNPFHAEVLENVVLTGRGSSKETRHVELSLEGSGLEYRPGDVLGVMPQNDPQVVAALLDRLDLAADVEVEVKKEKLSLREALSNRFEITAATPRFIEHWAEIADAEELRTLSTAEQAKERMAFLGGHHVVDIIDRYPVKAVEAERLLAGLRPLQPRLYSIASSLEAAPEEVHLTVSTVQYELHGTGRTGVTSGHLAGLTEEGATVPVYVQSNDHFHLPDDDTPILMIGAGTGVAPYRSFMQEREVRGVEGKSWLFFGERNFRSDFLYQVEWQDLFRDGVLDQLDLAFSRDSAEKVYVQDRLRRRGREVYAWLEDGASVYVCGDATHMAPDVHAALAEVISEHGGLDSEAAEEYLSDMRRNHRYRLDVY